MSDTTTTIRIKRQTYNSLKDVAKQEHVSLQDVLDKLLEQYKTRKFFAELQQSVTHAKSQPDLWAEELQERQAWEATLSDGLEDGDTNETR
jgi:predicted CopG family antitoxin